MTLDTETEARVRASFARQSMMATLGAELIDLGKGTARIAAPILPGSRQQQDAGHAGLTFAIGDSAAGYAALTLFHPDDEIMTVEQMVEWFALGDLNKGAARFDYVKLENVNGHYIRSATPERL